MCCKNGQTPAVRRFSPQTGTGRLWRRCGAASERNTWWRTRIFQTQCCGLDARRCAARWAHLQGIATRVTPAAGAPMAAHVARSEPPRPPGCKMLPKQATPSCSPSVRRILFCTAQTAQVSVQFNVLFHRAFEAFLI